jgi:Family of unknown function (DUF6065)
MSTTAAESSASPEPLVTFFRAIPDGRNPIRADRSALGTVPAAAFQYCEAVTSASAFGWYAFLPRTVWLQWDGTDAQWTHEGLDRWLSVKADLYPGYEDWFDAHAPDEVKGYCPPFVSQTLAPGVVQLWTGLFMRSREGWSTLVRPMANVPRSKHYEVYEGIVETDRWFGPLFINIRMTVTDTPVELSAARPLFQIQPLLRETYAERQLRATQTVQSLAEMPAADWERYRKTVVQTSADPTRQPGGYATAVRKRQAAEGR